MWCLIKGHHYLLSREYAGILKSDVRHFKTSSPLGVLTGYLGDTLYLTFTIYSIDCPSSLSSNHLDANLHFPVTMLFNNRRKRSFARYQAVSVRCPVQMTSNPTGCHKQTTQNHTTHLRNDYIQANCRIPLWTIYILIENKLQNVIPWKMLFNTF